MELSWTPLPTLILDIINECSLCVFTDETGDHSESDVDSHPEVDSNESEEEEIDSAPSSLELDDEVITGLYTTQGNDMIANGNFTYTKKRDLANGKTSWRCTGRNKKFKCSALITCHEIDGTMRVLSRNNDGRHWHDSDPTAIKRNMVGFNKI